jgi:flagellar biogenesis protein FliO
VSQRRAADGWFLDRGLPAVLRPGALVRRLWPRSAPAFATFAVFMVNSALVVQITGKHTIDIEGEPTRTEWFVLGLLVFVLPIGATVGWLVSRIHTLRGRTVSATVAVAIAIAGGVLGGPSASVLVDLIFEGIVIAVILALTASGAGSILGWAIQMTMSNLAAAGALAIRALPILLLTFLVFFNSPVWLMAATVSRGRLWLALLFLTAIAAAFVVSVTAERVRPLMEADPAGDRSAQLAGTPFETMPNPSQARPLSRGERLNVMFVVAATQVSQILIIAAMTALLFLILGLILLSPELLAAWTRNGRSDGTVLGMTIPVPDSLIQITFFLGGLTFMYMSASTASDNNYRSRFFEPLIDDVRLTLTARNRYRAAVSAR